MAGIVLDVMRKQCKKSPALIPGKNWSPLSLPVPNSEVSAILDTFKTGSVLVRAVAGSGKTTCIKQVLANSASLGNVLVLAFNKSIKEELTEALPVGIDVSTFHALALRILKNRNSRTTVNTKLLDDVLLFYREKI
jgi:hypothetical protein